MDFPLLADRGFSYAHPLMDTQSRVEVYQIHVWIRQVSPLIWRRLLVRTESTLADFHDALQIAFDWTDAHLHRFHIHGQDYGISRRGGLSFSSDAHRVRLSDFHFRINERFLYEYDLMDRWEHEVRIERHMKAGSSHQLSRVRGRSARRT